MRSAFLVTARELQSALQRPTVVAVLGGFVAFVALFTLWLDDVLLGGVATMRSTFFWIQAGLLLGVPALTMGLLAEEFRAGTMLLLGSLPLSPVELVLGKWGYAVVLVAIALLLTAPWPVLLWSYGALDPGPVFAGYLGLLLAGVTLGAVGTACSAATDSQVVAFLSTLALALVPWSVGLALTAVPAAWVPVIQPLTVAHYLDPFSAGVLELRGVVFFGTATAVALRVAVHLLDARRLR